MKRPWPFCDGSASVVSSKRCEHTKNDKKDKKKQMYLQDISTFHFHAFFGMVKSTIFLNFELFKGFF